MVTVHDLIEVGAASIAVMAVALIVGAFLWSSVSFLFHRRKQASNRYEQYKFLGSAPSLGLEFLVTADVIRTVTRAPRSAASESGRRSS